MTQAHWTDRLSDYLDNDLTAGERAAADAHLRECAACRATLDELRAVTARAHALADRTPVNDLWPGIAAAIGSDITPLAPRRQRAPTARRFSFSMPQLAAAAVLLMAVSGGAVWTLRNGGRAPEASVAAAPVRSPATRGALPGGSGVRPTEFTTVRPTAEQSYDAAVADLEQVLKEGRGRLDDRTLQIVQKNLATIDSAVTQARRAVEQDPANAYLNSYLAHTMRRKIDLLRQVVALTSAQS
jgi:anti-sigma factor RsiW